MSRKLALIIGNSEYQDASLAGLSAPDADVQALAEVLRDPQIGAFDEVSALVNQPTTTVRRAISAFFVERAQDDLLLLYFSGHGIRDDRGQLFLAVKDTELNLLRGTAVPAGFITEEMDNCRSRRQVLILDCCHSGAFSHGMKAAAGASVGTAAAFEGTGSGRVVLTATDSTQYAWEGDHVVGQADNSVFTHYLIQGLRTGAADTDADGRITLDELYNYVYEQVIERTPMQTPGKWSYGQRGEIVVARNPRPVVKPLELPPDLQQTIEDPRPWVREGAVQELERILRGSNKGLALSAFTALKRLADDDSRRVASTAAACLAAYANAQPEQVETGPAPTAPDQPGQPQAQERPASAPEETERSLRQAVQPARLSVEPVAAPQLADKMIVLERDQPAAAAGRSQPYLDRRLQLILWTILGWGAGFALAFYISTLNDSPLVGSIAGVISGLNIGLVLRRVEPDLHWPQILIISLGWGIGITLIWGPNSPLVKGFSAAGWGTNWPIIDGISGLIGGLITALVLRWMKPHLRWMQLLWITLGWTMSGFIFQVLYNLLIAHANSTPVMVLFGALIGAGPSLLGSAVMFWQLSQVNKPSAAGPDRPLREPSHPRVEAESKVAGQAGPTSAGLDRAVAPGNSLWPLAALILGWALLWACGWVYGSSVGWYGDNYENSWIILGTFGGLITGLVMWQIKPSIHWAQILLITAGWTIGIIAGGVVSQALFHTESTAFNGTVHGTIGGLVTGLVVLWTDRSTRWKQILIIALGWAIGWTIHQALAHDVYNLFSNTFSTYSFGWMIPGAMIELITALIGSVVMFWQLGQFAGSAPGQSSLPTQPPAGND